MALKASKLLARIIPASLIMMTVVIVMVVFFNDKPSIEPEHDQPVSSSSDAEGSEIVLVKDMLKQWNQLSPDLGEDKVKSLEKAMMESSDEAVREIIQQTLEDGLLNDGKDVELKRSHEDKLVSAIRIAGGQRIQENMGLLLELAKDPEHSQKVYETVVEVLAFHSSKEIMSFLKKELSHNEDAHQQSLLLLALASQEDSRADDFVPYLSSSDKDLQQNAIMALGELKAKDSVMLLKKVYADSEEDTRILIAQSLIEIDSPEATSFLSEIAASSKGPLQQLASRGKN